MNATPNYEIKLVQGQHQHLSQGQLQSLRILQCSSAELEGIVANALLENPMLEVDDSSNEYENTASQYFEKIEADNLLRGRNDQIASLQNDISNYVYSAIPEEQSLHEYLKIQLGYTSLKEDCRSAAEYVIESLDDNGYMTQSVAELSAALKKTEEELRDVINVIQSLDPPGVAAENLEECLKLQLERLGIYDCFFEKIICDHKKELAVKNYSFIARELGINKSEVERRCVVIRALNPKPGSGIGTNSDTNYVIPDFYVFEEDGEIVILANERITPHIKINQNYYRSLKAEKDDEDLAEYIRDKRAAAIRLVEALERRRTTINEIAERIFSRQCEFIRIGAAGLVPMTLEDIAVEMNIYPSTVSRAIREKYVQTPHGVYPFKYFFTSSIRQIGGSEISSEYVRELISLLVRNEEKTKPLSDEALRKCLQSRYNVDIARRTVTKYREMCGIPKYSLRKMHL